jgi:hypothetical protein
MWYLKNLRVLCELCGKEKMKKDSQPFDSTGGGEFEKISPLRIEMTGSSELEV